MKIYVNMAWNDQNASSQKACICTPAKVDQAS